MKVPGESLPTDELSSSGASTSTQGSPSSTAATSAQVSPSSTAAAASEASTTSHLHLSNGAIAGIAVGAVVVVAALGFLLFLLGRHRTEIRFLRRDVNVQRHSHGPASPAPMHEYSGAGYQQTLSPSVPYNSEDLKIREHQDAVPPYSQYTDQSRPIVAELPSPSIGTSTGRHGSPFGELGTHNDSMAGAQRNIYTGYGSGTSSVGGGGGGGGGVSGGLSDSS